MMLSLTEMINGGGANVTEMMDLTSLRLECSL